MNPASTDTCRTDRKHQHCRCGNRYQTKLPRAVVTLLARGNVADTFVIWVSFKVRSVGDVVYLMPCSGELAQDINVAVSAFVGSEDVVVWDQDDLSGPKPWHHPKLALEHTDSAGTTDIMSHQQVN